MSREHTPCYQEYSIWVMGFYGAAIPVQVTANQTVASLRRQISWIPECADGSPAWTINGWNLPKVAFGNTLLRDRDTLREAGVVAGSTLQPIYDSSSYIEPIIDLDFYGGGRRHEVTELTEQMPDCREVCDSVRKGGERVKEGWAGLMEGLQKTTGVGGLCTAGIGVAVQQDDALRFCITHLAPAGPAEQEGVRIGDVIVAVDDTACVDGAGLDAAAVGKIRQLAAARAARRDAGGWFGSWGGGDEDGDGWAGAAITNIEDLRRALSGLVGTTVTVRIRRADRPRDVIVVPLQRKTLTQYAGDYI